MDELITIVVPVYNVEKYVGKCIKSILKQSYNNFELIIVNDGSTDNSLSICEEYAKKDVRIKLISQKNKGLSGARNLGIENMSGEYIVFIDSDDMVSEEFLEKLYEQIVKNDADMAWSPYLPFYERENPFEKVKISDRIELVECDDVYKRLFGKNAEYLIVSHGKLYKKSVFNTLRFKEGVIHEDEFIVHHILLECKKTVFIDTNLYFYLQREGSIMNSNFNLNKLVRLDALEDRYNLLKKTKYKDLAIERILDDILYFYINISKYYPKELNVLSDISEKFKRYFKEKKIEFNKKYFHYLIFRFSKEIYLGLKGK